MISPFSEQMFANHSQLSLLSMTHSNPMHVSYPSFSELTLAFMSHVTIRMSCHGDLSICSFVLISLFGWCMILHESGLGKFGVKLCSNDTGVDWFPFHHAFLGELIHDESNPFMVLAIGSPVVAYGFSRGKRHCFLCQSVAPRSVPVR